jgi:uncharacterized membrane protein
MDILSIFLLAMTPIGELRASIPFGIGLHRIDWITVYLVSIAGNMVPPIIIIGSLDRLHFLKKYTFFIRQSDKKKRWIKRFGWLGLLLLVAIPLPGTGAWTGSMLAWLLKLPKIPALLIIFWGLCMAGMIVSMASLGIIHLVNYPIR